MINRNVSLYSMLLNMWVRDLDIEDTLHHCTAMGFSRCVVEPRIAPAFAKFTADYTELMESQPDPHFVQDLI